MSADGPTPQFVRDDGKTGYGLLYGVVCSEWVPYEAPSQVRTTGKQQFPDYPGSVLAQAPRFRT